jgi:hypothetical protein
VVAWASQPNHLVAMLVAMEKRRLEIVKHIENIMDYWIEVWSYIVIKCSPHKVASVIIQISIVFGLILMAFIITGVLLLLKHPN